VVLAPDGSIVGEGRGRRFEPPVVDRQLAHTRIAHAEINALAVLPPHRSYEDHRLLTTLEPCCMCLGAVIQSTITSLHYAAPDPYAGSCGLVVETPQARRRPLTTHGPLRNQHGVFAELLHMAWLLDQPSTAAVLEPHRAARPDAYAAAVRARPLLTNLRTSHASVTAAMDAVTSPNASRSRSR
jgi:tRNA(Arg) A34 adenosine deaminase TadA